MATTADMSTFPIKTVVVLVMENRSFDHMLGWMKSLNPEIDGVDGTEFNPLSTSDPGANAVFFGNTSTYVNPDPGHSIEDIYEQLYGVKYSADLPSSPSTPPPMNGFAQQAESVNPGMSATVMNGFLPDALPVYKELVTEFGVCDRWHSSLPSSTQPNRLFVHSATSHGLTSNDTSELVGGLPQKTIFDSLDDAGLSFGIYFQYPPGTLFYRNLRRLKYIGKFHLFDLQFQKHCKEGTLPNYVVVEQRYFDLKLLPGNDDHPPHDVIEGQKFVKDVYEALRSSPQWNEILFVITYDEHGGFYDHVPTPVGVPSPDGVVGPPPFNFKFDRLGVRVPTIFVSPWIKRGTVIHKPSGPDPTSEYEHSSIPATVKKIFNLPEFLTRRDEWAGTFETVVNRSTPRTDCPVTLPEPKKLRQAVTDAEKDTGLSSFQQELVQLAAVLNGDHADEDVFPHKLLENMSVADAAKYTTDAFDVFREECDRCRRNGMDESEVVTVKRSAVGGAKARKKETTLAPKLLSCFMCTQS